jgi:hypothetical protein
MLFDKPDLPLPVPFLQMLLRREGIINSDKALEIDEPVHTISSGESSNLVSSVLMDSQAKVARHTHIQCAVLLAGQDVHIVTLHFLRFLDPRLRGGDMM